MRASPEVSGFAFFSDFGGGHEFSSLNFVKCLMGLYACVGDFQYRGLSFASFVGFLLYSWVFTLELCLELSALDTACRGGFLRDCNQKTPAFGECFFRRI